MSKHLQRDLENLDRGLLELAADVEESVRKAVQALRERSPQLARLVIAGDDAIDDEENRVGEDCLKLLALHQPVAGDLRRVSAAQRISNDLERVGDLAEDIAERVLHLGGFPTTTTPDLMFTLADLAVQMIHESLDAFVTRDVKRARRVCRLDDEADRLNSELIAGLVALMKLSPDLVEPGLSLFSVVRHLERVADHATNIAEDVIYLVEGDIVRHHPERLNDKD
jgi:phosphate transport system protein